MARAYPIRTNLLRSAPATLGVPIGALAVALAGSGFGRVSRQPSIEACGVYSCHRVRRPYCYPGNSGQVCNSLAKAAADFA